MQALKNDYGALFRLNNLTISTGLNLNYRPSFFESINLHRNVSYLRTRIVRDTDDQFVEKIETEKQWDVRKS